MNEQRGGPSAQNEANIVAQVFRGNRGLHELLLFQTMTLLEPSVLPLDDDLNHVTSICSIWIYI